jgi:DUF1680 family protein
MESDYPWEGNASLIIDDTDGSAWRLSLRIPGWASGASIQVNSVPVEALVEPGQYTIIERNWQAGDTVEISLPMRPGLVEAHPWIDSTRSSAAIRRGPILYCVEQADQAEPVLAIQIDESTPLETEWSADLLGGVVVVKACGIRPDISGWDGQLYRSINGNAAPTDQPALITAIPYFAWGNRGANAMRVWIPRKGC